MGLTILGVVLHSISAFVFAGLAWITLLCKGDTVRKLTILFGILSIKSLLLLIVILLVGIGVVSVSEEFKFILIGSPVLEVLSTLPFGFSMLQQTRQSNGK